MNYIFCMLLLFDFTLRCIFLRTVVRVSTDRSPNVGTLRYGFRPSATPFLNHYFTFLNPILVFCGRLSLTLVLPKVLTLGKMQIYLSILSLNCNFARNFGQTSQKTTNECTLHCSPAHRVEHIYDARMVRALETTTGRHLFVVAAMGYHLVFLGHCPGRIQPTGTCQSYRF